jgi:hypothetical protein
MLAVSHQADRYIVSAMHCHFSFIGTTQTLSQLYWRSHERKQHDEPNQPGQQNQSPGQKPAQQQGGGQKPGQQSQAPAKDNKNPREPHEQASNTDT